MNTMKENKPTIRFLN